MKTLQNNFTTQEQSKRLLELGVPEDSADCYLLRTHTKGDTFIVEVLHDELYSKKDKFTNMLEYLPCWSVGRLIEICLKCSTLEQRRVLFYCNGDDDYYDFMDYTITVLESGIMMNHMDFSKLEE